MATERPSNDIKSLWSSQQTEGFSMSLGELRSRAEKFQRRVRGRNMREYVAAIVIVLWFGLYVFILPGIVTKTGSALIILAALYVAWQLHRRGSARTPPVADSVMAHLDFHRRELIRQRDALRSVATWYLAPFLPGFATMLIGIALHSPMKSVWLGVSVTAGLCVIVFGAIWQLNRWGAARLQKQIDVLNGTSN